MRFEKLNSVILGFLTNISGTLAMFLVTIFLTNTIDQKIYGEFRLAFAFIGLLSILLLLGRDTGILYYTQIEKNELKKNKIIAEESFNTLIILTIGTFLLIIFKSFFISKIFNNNISESNYLISLIMLPLWGFFNFGISCLRSKLFINYSFTLTNLIQRLLRVPFFVILVYLDKSFFSLALSMIISQFFLVLAVIKKLPILINFKKVNLFSFFKRFSYSLQLGISSIIFVVLTKIDIIMLGKFGSIEDVAIYDICILLSFVVWFPYFSLVKSSEPIIKSIINNKSLLKKYNFDLKVAVSLSSLIVFIFCLFTTLILSIFGENYVNGKETLLILSFGYLIFNFLASPIEFLNMVGFVKISVVILILSLVINVILNYVLIISIGMEGASISTIISLLLSKIVALFFVRKKMNMKIIDYNNFYKLVPLLTFCVIFLLMKDYLVISLTNEFVIKSLILLGFLVTFYINNKNDIKIILKIQK